MEVTAIYLFWKRNTIWLMPENLFYDLFLIDPLNGQVKENQLLKLSWD